MDTDFKITRASSDIASLEDIAYLSSIYEVIEMERWASLDATYCLSKEAARLTA